MTSQADAWIDETRNQLALRLRQQLGDDWLCEAESDCVARGYTPDPREADPEQIVSVEVRNDSGENFIVQTIAYNEALGMGDLHSYDNAGSITHAISMAGEMAAKVQHEVEHR